MHIHYLDKIEQTKHNKNKLDNNEGMKKACAKTETEHIPLHFFFLELNNRKTIFFAFLIFECKQILLFNRVK